MLHMTFGCSMHHGLGTNACAHQHETACDHEYDAHDDEHHGDHEHHDDDQPNSELAHDVDNHGPCHTGCSDDGCHVTQFVQFKFQSLDFSVPYFGSVDAMALVEGWNCRVSEVDPFPDRMHTRAGMRAHLHFGVQIV